MKFLLLLALAGLAYASSSSSSSSSSTSRGFEYNSDYVPKDVMRWADEMSERLVKEANVYAQNKDELDQIIHLARKHRERYERLCDKRGVSSSSSSVDLPYAQARATKDECDTHVKEVMNLAKDHAKDLKDALKAAEESN